MRGEQSEVTDMFDGCERLPGKVPSLIPTSSGLSVGSPKSDLHRIHPSPPAQPSSGSGATDPHPPSEGVAGSRLRHLQAAQPTDPLHPAGLHIPATCKPSSTGSFTGSPQAVQVAAAPPEAHDDAMHPSAAAYLTDAPLDRTPLDQTQLLGGGGGGPVANRVLRLVQQQQVPPPSEPTGRSGAPPCLPAGHGQRQGSPAPSPRHSALLSSRGLTPHPSPHPSQHQQHIQLQQGRVRGEDDEAAGQQLAYALGQPDAALRTGGRSSGRGGLQRQPSGGERQPPPITASVDTASAAGGGRFSAGGSGLPAGLTATRTGTGAGAGGAVSPTQRHGGQGQYLLLQQQQQQQPLHEQQQQQQQLSDDGLPRQTLGQPQPMKLLGPGGDSGVDRAAMEAHVRARLGLPPRRIRASSASSAGLGPGALLSGTSAMGDWSQGPAPVFGGGGRPGASVAFGPGPGQADPRSLSDSPSVPPSGGPFGGALPLQLVSEHADGAGAGAGLGFGLGLGAGLGLGVGLGPEAAERRDSPGPRMQLSSSPAVMQMCQQPNPQQQQQRQQRQQQQQLRLTGPGGANPSRGGGPGLGTGAGAGPGMSGHDVRTWPGNLGGGPMIGSGGGSGGSGMLGPEGPLLEIGGGSGGSGGGQRDARSWSSAQRGGGPGPMSASGGGGVLGPDGPLLGAGGGCGHRLGAGVAAVQQQQQLERSCSAPQAVLETQVAAARLRRMEQLGISPSQAVRALASRSSLPDTIASAPLLRELPAGGGLYGGGGGGGPGNGSLGGSGLGGGGGITGGSSAAFVDRGPLPLPGRLRESCLGPGIGPTPASSSPLSGGSSLKRSASDRRWEEQQQQRQQQQSQLQSLQSLGDLQDAGAGGPWTPYPLPQQPLHPLQNQFHRPQQSPGGPGPHGPSGSFRASGSRLQQLSGMGAPPGGGSTGMGPGLGLSAPGLGPVSELYDGAGAAGPAGMGSAGLEDLHALKRRAFAAPESRQHQGLGFGGGLCGGGASGGGVGGLSSSVGGGLGAPGPGAGLGIGPGGALRTMGPQQLRYQRLPSGSAGSGGGPQWAFQSMPDDVRAAAAVSGPSGLGPGPMLGLGPDAGPPPPPPQRMLGLGGGNGHSSGAGMGMIMGMGPESCGPMGLSGPMGPRVDPPGGLGSMGFSDLGGLGSAPMNCMLPGPALGQGLGSGGGGFTGDGSGGGMSANASMSGLRRGFSDAAMELAAELVGSGEPDYIADNELQSFIQELCEPGSGGGAPAPAPDGGGLGGGTGAGMTPGVQRPSAAGGASGGAGAGAGRRSGGGAGGGGGGAAARRPSLPRLALDDEQRLIQNEAAALLSFQFE